MLLCHKKKKTPSKTTCDHNYMQLFWFFLGFIWMGPLVSVVQKGWQRDTELIMLFPLYFGTKIIIIYSV